MAKEKERQKKLVQQMKNRLDVHKRKEKEEKDRANFLAEVEKRHGHQWGDNPVQTIANLLIDSY